MEANIRMKFSGGGILTLLMIEYVFMITYVFY